MLLPNYRDIVVWGTGNLFTDRWIPAEKWRSNVLLATKPTTSVQQWHIQCSLEEERYLSVAELDAARDITNNDARYEALERLVTSGVDGVTQLDGQGRKYGSFLKVRLTWMDGASRKRSIDMDLGASIDIVSPPCSQLRAEILIPDPDTTRPSPAIPVGVQAFISRVTSCAYCLGYGGNSRLNSVRYTDTVYLQADDTPLFQSVDIPRKRSTMRVTASSNNPIGVVRAVWSPSPPVGTGVPIIFIVGSFSPNPPGGNQLAINDIPGSTNIWRYNLPAGQPNTIFSLVQELTF